MQTSIIKSKTHLFMPLHLSTSLYQQWDCEVQLRYTESNVYYKCLEGYATIDLANGNKYEGMIQNGLFDGKGRFVWKSGLVYDGDFYQNKIEGKGRFKWPDGSFYEGEVQNGYRQGNGRFYSNADGCEYIGEWDHGLYCGKGRINYADGSYYEGQFEQNKKHGKGKMVYASKNQYEGSWVYDKKEGKGVMNWYREHQKYTGEWVNNLPHGYGEYYWFQNKVQYKIIKTIYKGRWVQGKRDGFGVFFYSNGCRFQGYFKNNQKNGLGINTDCNGKSKLDEYKNNRLKELIGKDLKNKANSTNKKVPQTDKQSFYDSTNGNTSNTKLPKLSLPKKTFENVSSAQNITTSTNLHFPIDNQYKYYLDFYHEEINQQFYNFLLRMNSKLRAIYRVLCTMSGSAKEFYTGLVLENVWKALKDLRIVNESNSLCRLNREFSNGYQNEFDLAMPSESVISILETDMELFDQYHYSQIQWEDFIKKLTNEQFSWESWTLNTELKLQEPAKVYDLHNPQKIILYRHFVCLLVHMANICLDLGPNLRKRMQSLISQLESYTEINTNRPDKSMFNIETQTVNGSKHIHVPDWSKPLNQSIIMALNQGRVQLIGKLDYSVSLRTIYLMLEANNILKDELQKMMFLERVERSMSNKTNLLKKDMKPFYSTLEKQVKQSPFFANLMNYEMHFKEVAQILYHAITRKITASSQEDLIQKYKEYVNKLLQYIKEENDEKPFPKAKKFKTEKDEAREELIRIEQEKRRREEMQARKREEEKREERERMKMKAEDKDVTEQEQESSEQDDYIF